MSKRSKARQAPSSRSGRRPPTPPRPPRAPVAIGSKPIGQLSQVVYRKNGKVYVHTFTQPAALHATAAPGLLVIRGRFKVNPAGFIED